VPEIGKGTSHFVLVGLSIEAWDWKKQDRAVTAVKAHYGLANSEVHTGWITRRYIEQEKIPHFVALDWPTRRLQAQNERNAQLVRVAALKGPKEAAELRKSYRKSQEYIHLTHGERLDFLRELADLIGSWGHARLFSDSIDKSSFGTVPPTTPPREEAFTHIVNRFQRYLVETGDQRSIGLLAHDHDDTSADRLTQLMRHFHSSGTMWNNITRIIETPFFVDSRLTVGVQLADLCAYAIRRYCENGETDLFNRVYTRGHRSGGKTVGMRHYVRGGGCACTICKDHW
jgi:hypothetical protein